MFYFEERSWLHWLQISECVIIAVETRALSEPEITVVETLAGNLAAIRCK